MRRFAALLAILTSSAAIAQTGEAPRPHIVVISAATPAFSARDDAIGCASPTFCDKFASARQSPDTMAP